MLKSSILSPSMSFHNSILQYTTYKNCFLSYKLALVNQSDTASCGSKIPFYYTSRKKALMRAKWHFSFVRRAWLFSFFRLLLVLVARFGPNDNILFYIFARIQHFMQISYYCILSSYIWKSYSFFIWTFRPFDFWKIAAIFLAQTFFLNGLKN